MKNFRWVIMSISFLLPVLSGQSTKASDIFENQKPDPKQLARLQKNLDYLQLPLSKLQILLMDNPFKDEKKKGSQYLSLEEARGLGECLYFFSVQKQIRDRRPSLELKKKDCALQRHLGIGVCCMFVQLS